MAGRERIRFDYKPRMPDASEINVDQVAFDYESDTDTLHVHFHGEPRPAVSVLLVGSHYGYARVDPETHTVVGLQFECFVSRVVHEHPTFLAIAELVGVPNRDIEQARREIPENRWKEEAIKALFDPPNSNPVSVPV